MAGSISPDLGSLSRLTVLNLHGNNLTGSIPSTLGSLTHLSGVSLGGNGLSGDIPPELGNLPKLKRLALQDNALTGSIPPELSSLTRLTVLNLHGNNLTGSIPSTLGSLTHLEEMRLGGNGLSGTIPPELGSLPKLRTLALQDNAFSGSIPTELGSLSELRTLNLNGSGLTGVVPAELASLSSLTHLYLGGNDLTGGIPAELGDLSALTLLNLSGNSRLGGSIPEELGVLSELRTLNLNGSGLTGVIPTELANLSKLTHLYLGGNDLTGGIPAELGDLSVLTLLNLSGNSLSGEIPPQLSKLTNLIVLRLRGNSLTGCQPAGLSDVPTNDLAATGLPDCPAPPGQVTGVTLEVKSNLDLRVSWTKPAFPDVPISGYTVAYCVMDDTSCTLDGLSTMFRTVPGETLETTISGLTVIATYQIWVAADNAGGRGKWSEPSTVKIVTQAMIMCSNGTAVPEPDDNPGLVTDCQYLTAAKDDLHGTADLNWDHSLSITEWEGIVVSGSPNRVTGLSIAHEPGSQPDPDSRLTGNIPAELGYLSQLRILRLTGHDLTGGIPEELGRLSELRTLNLNDSGLTDDIPTELASLSNLTHLYLGGNDLTGGIPAELGNLSALTLLNLSGNSRLGGSIPEELGRLSELRTLNLNDSGLTDDVPTELASLSSLTHLYLGGNDLTGGIPAELGDLSALILLNLSGNSRLGGSIPEELGVLSELRTLNLNGSGLTGVIPTELANLSKLTHLYLGGNDLTDGIPAGLGDLSALTLLNLSNNSLSGDIPPELSKLTNLTVLRLRGNSLTGCLPVGLSDVPTNDLADTGLPDCQPPGQVTGVGVEVVSDTKLIVSWTAAGDSAAVPITGYTIAYCVDGSDCSVNSASASVQQAPPAASEATLSGLTPNTTYRVWVAAENADGRGEWSDSSTATTDAFALPKPDDLTLTNGETVQVILPEAVHVEGAITYAIAGDLPPGLVFDPETREIAGTPTTSQAPATYSYVATNSTETEANRVIKTFSITVRPAIPSDVVAEPDRNEEGEPEAYWVHLCWADSVDEGRTGWLVQRGEYQTDLGQDLVVAWSGWKKEALTTEEKVNCFLDPGLAKDKSYVYRVRAYAGTDTYGPYRLAQPVAPGTIPVDGGRTPIFEFTENPIIQGTGRTKLTVRFSQSAISETVFKFELSVPWLNFAQSPDSITIPAYELEGNRHLNIASLRNPDNHVSGVLRVKWYPDPESNFSNIEYGLEKAILIDVIHPSDMTDPGVTP